MIELSRGARWFLRIGTAVTMAFLYVPLLVIAVYAFNTRRTAVWPPPGFTLHWFDRAFRNAGVLDALLATPGIGGPSLSTSYLGMFLVFTYMWLPFMILPMAAALERVPGSLIQASADLGARPGQTFRNVVLPLAIPGIAAGSVFTFSLTLGDYIIPSVVGAPGYFIGMMVYVQQGTAGNIPLAAAFSVVPIVLIFIYLSVARRFGAFDAL